MKQKIDKLCLVVFLFISTKAFGATPSIDPKSLNLLKELVEINSGSDNLEGLEAVRKKIIPQFQSLGFEVRTEDIKNGRKLLMFEFSGSKPKILFAGHIDTVFSVHSTFRKFTQVGDELHGPGVMDMKGGIVMMLDLISSLDRNLRSQIRVVLNDDEEIGSPNSKQKFDDYAKDVPIGLVFEPSLPDGHIITSSSGVYWAEITVKGRAAHAGSDFQKGLNACVALSEKLVSVSKLTNLKMPLTVNVGSMNGGTQPNVVCESASAKIDIRYSRKEDLETVIGQIKQVVARRDSLNVKTNETPSGEMRELLRVSSLSDESNQKLLSRMQTIAKTLSMDVIGDHSAFASDGNHLAATGMQVLVGIAAAGSGAHTENESLNLLSYPEKLRLNVAFVRDILSTSRR
jgi:glutamate carboxypeptidase